MLCVNYQIDTLVERSLDPENPPAVVNMTAVSYSPIAAAKATGISRTRLYEAMAAGELDYHTNGRIRVILHSDLVDYVKGLPKQGQGDRVANDLNKAREIKRAERAAESAK